MGRDHVVAGRAGGVHLVDVRVERRMRQLHADVNRIAGLFLEMRQPCVERVVLRPADEGYVELLPLH